MGRRGFTVRSRPIAFRARWSADDLGLGPIPARLAPVFRDREELPTATDLGNILSQALRDSAFQIVICSPAAARSRWVNEEVLDVQAASGGSDRILCLIVDGEP